jgi:hypothetical protein
VTFLAFLIPLAVLGLIAWVIVGFARGRGGGEPFTLAGATALYARAMVIVGIVMALSGAGTILKAAFALINFAYSYSVPQFGYAPLTPAGVTAPQTPPTYLDQQRGQDLVLGITLLVVGVLVAVGHHNLARAVANMTGGSPAWITRGALLALTAVTAIAGIWSTAIGLNQMLGYFIIGPTQSQQPWGESVGMAIAFVPAWIYAMTRLVEDLRRPHLGATPA